MFGHELMKPMLPTFLSNLVKTKHNHLIVEVIKFGISRHITSDRTIKHNVAKEFLGTLVTITLVCNKDESAKMVAKNHYLNVATLALGSRPRQRGCKGVGQREAQESHQGLPGV
jgi:hypothetical protein